jgi:PAS domain S-box-containing protein
MRTGSPRKRQRGRQDRDTDGWLEEVLFSFADAVVVCDNRSRVVLFNQAAEELTGLARARVLGRSGKEVFGGFPAAAEMVRRVLRTGQNESRGDETFHRALKSIPIRVSCLAVIGSNHEMHGAALVIRDLSHQRALEEAARRNESLARLGTLVAGLAHEVRNPLAGIKGAAQLLARRLKETPEVEEYTTVIVREADRLGRLVEDLLTLGAPSRPNRERINVHRLIGHVLSLMKPDVECRGLDLECEFDPSLPDICGDQEQLTQVLLNLMRNALESMDETVPRISPCNRIVLRTRLETDFRVVHDQHGPTRFLRIEVLDWGRGIAPSDAARVFEPFFTTKPRGTGLGLAVAYRIVAEHGGTIRAEPNPPHGTCMTVSLPVAPSEGG